ncbi:MAG: hypothetical protein PHI12_01365 [Dehalococcoidales bacterium]|nr:hypothetical protein [Dehalococcoidales bacterium]
MIYLRIAVYSSETIAERVSKCLNGTETTLVPILPGVFARRDFPALDRLLDADLIIMEAASPDATNVCQHLKRFWHVPLIMLVDQSHVDWEQLCWCGASGYIPLSAGEREFDSRINSATQNLIAKLSVPARGESRL